MRHGGVKCELLVTATRGTEGVECELLVAAAQGTECAQ